MYPAKTSVSPRPSSLGTFRAEEQVPPCKTSPAAKSEEKRIFLQASKNENSQKGYHDPLYMISAMFVGVVMHLYILGLT